jgi:hypothetical protein
MNNSLRTIDNLIVGSLLSEPINHEIGLCGIQNISNNIIYTIPNLLLESECHNIIKNINNSKNTFINIAGWEAEKRESARMCILDNSISNIIWDRIKDVIQFPANIQPYGFLSQGVWKPIGINKCIRINRYVAANDILNIGFIAHYDGQYTETVDKRSIYTVIIYLTDDFEGGETIFYDKKDEIKVPDVTMNELLKINGGLEQYNKISIVPKVGTCVIFPHNTLHSCNSLRNGIRIVLKTEIIFECIERTNYDLNLQHYILAATHQMTAQNLELHNQNNKASELYEKSISIRLVQNDTINNMTINKFLRMRDMWSIIIKYLSSIDTLMLHFVCRITNLYTKQKSQIENIPIFGQNHVYDNYHNAKNRLTHNFHIQFHNKDIEACVRLSAIKCLIDYETHSLCEDYIAHYDPETRRILKCSKNHLYYCAYHGIECTGRYYNLDASDLPSHNQNSIGILNGHGVIDSNKILSSGKAIPLDDIDMCEQYEHDNDIFKDNDTPDFDEIVTKFESIYGNEQNSVIVQNNDLVENDKVQNNDVVQNVKELFTRTINTNHKSNATEKTVIKYICIEHGISVCDCGWNGDCRLTDDVRINKVDKKIMSNSLIFDFSTNKIHIEKTSLCYKTYMACYEVTFPTRSFYHAACKCSGSSFGTTFDSKIIKAKQKITTLEKIHICICESTFYSMPCITHYVKYIAVNVL